MTPSLSVILLICVAMAIALWRRQQRMRRFFAARLRDAATPLPGPCTATMACVLLAAGAIALAARLARHERQAAKDAPPTLFFLLDCSPSMLAESHAGTRLDEAREAIHRLCAALPDAELALLTFAGNALLDFPPSHDHQAFRQALAAVTPSLTFAAGSSPTQALLALDALMTDSQRPEHAVIILLSDGEIHDANPLLQDALWAARPYPLLRLLAGIPGQVRPVPNTHGQGTLWLSDPDTGDNAMSRADDRALARLAALSPLATAGCPAATPGAELATLVRQLAGGQASSMPRRAARLAAALALALLLAALALSRRQPPRRRLVAAGMMSKALLLSLIAQIGSLGAQPTSPLTGSAAERQEALAAIRAVVATPGIADVERARQLSNWAALLLVDAQAQLAAGDASAAQQLATTARALCREALRLQPGGKNPQQNLSAAWKIMLQARETPQSSPGRETPEPPASATPANNDQAPRRQNNGPPNDLNAATQRAAANAGQAAATTAEDGAPADQSPAPRAAAGPPTPGTWRELQGRRAYRPPRAPGVKPW